jgi:hypothetical protein
MCSMPEDAGPGNGGNDCAKTSLCEPMRNAAPPNNAAPPANDETVAQAEIALKSTEAAATNAGIARAQDEHAIALLVGEPASTFSVPVTPLTTEVPHIPVGIPSELLERRPDVARAE